MLHNLELTHKFSAQNFELKSNAGRIEILKLIYADDHTIINSSKLGAQRVLDLIQKWLAWTECMEAKPKKCKCLALLNRSSNKKNSHGLIDPDLKIGTHKIEHINNSILKFLGRFISFDMKNMTQRKIICESFKTNMKIVDAQFISGASKAWIYNNYVMAYLA